MATPVDRPYPLETVPFSKAEFSSSMNSDNVAVQRLPITSIAIPPDPTIPLQQRCYAAAGLRPPCTEKL
jgi:hypothetical protein